MTRPRPVLFATLLLFVRAPLARAEMYDYTVDRLDMRSATILRLPDPRSRSDRVIGR